MDSNKYFWCYGCSRFIRESGVCPQCRTGFVEEIDIPSPSIHTESSRVRFLSDTMNMLSNNTNSGFRQTNRDNHPRLNLAIVIREGDRVRGGERSSYELYIDDGSGLLPCSTAMHDFFMESGYRLFNQFAARESNIMGRCNQQRVSKATVESMPVIEISDCHVSSETECAVCNQVFQIGTEAREMPCKHIYHTDCILQWLLLRNSCPVCRYKMPTDINGGFNTPGAIRIILCQFIIDGRSNSGIRKVFRNIFSCFRWSSSNSRDRYWELVGRGGLSWHRLR